MTSSTPHFPGLPNPEDLPVAFVRDAGEAAFAGPLATLNQLSNRIEQLRAQLLFQRIGAVMASQPDGVWRVCFDATIEKGVPLAGVRVSYLPDEDWGDPSNPGQALEEWLSDQMCADTLVNLDALDGCSLIVRDGQCPGLEELAVQMWGKEYLAAWQKDRLVDGLEAPKVLGRPALRL